MEGALDDISSTPSTARGLPGGTLWLAAAATPIRIASFSVPMPPPPQTLVASSARATEGGQDSDDEDERSRVKALEAALLAANRDIRARTEAMAQLQATVSDLEAANAEQAAVIVARDSEVARLKATIDALEAEATASRLVRRGRRPTQTKAAPEAFESSIPALPPIGAARASM